MNESVIGLENLTKSAGKVLELMYKDFGKSFIFICCIAIVIFTTQYLLLPIDFLTNDFNWKIVVIVFGFSLYWYIISFVSIATLFLKLIFFLPKENELIGAYSFVSSFAFLFGVILLFAVTLVVYCAQIWIPYSLYIHLLFFFLASLFPVWIFVRSWEAILKGVNRQSKNLT